MACCTATALHLPGAAGHPVLTRGGIVPARRNRLRRSGVRTVPVPAAAVPATVGWGSLSIRRVAAGAGNGQVVPSSVVTSLSLDSGGFNMLTVHAFDGLWVLDYVVPATAKKQFAGKYADVKSGLEKAVRLAQEPNNHMRAAIEVMRGWYGIVELAYASCANARMPPLPGERVFLGRCLTADEPVILGQTVAPLIAPLHASLANLAERGMPESDVDVIRSMFIAVVVCQAVVKTASANYVCGEPDIV